MGDIELFSLIRKWGEDRGINNPDKQMAKITEEVGEIAHEICRGNYNSPEIRDAIGDSLVTIIILANILGYKAEYCLKDASDEIAGRTGVTVSGCFVKDE